MATKAIPVVAAKVPSTQTNFPVYIKPSAMTGWTTLTTAEAESIRFYSDSGLTTELAREVVSADEIHVKVPSLTTTTTIYADYDGVRADYAATDTYGRNAVWSGYVAVYHLDGVTDSTGNYGLTNVNSTSFGTGKLGNAALLNGTNNSLRYPASGNGAKVFTHTATCTYQAWVKPTSLIDNNTILGVFSSTTNDEAPWWWTDTSGNLKTRYVPSFTSSGATLSAGNWSAVALEYSGGLGRFFINSVARGTASHGTLYTVDTFLSIGTRTGSAQYGNHAVDEFRFSNIAFSSNWKTTEYNNQSDVATFWGTVTDAGGAAASTGFMAFM